jgi:hypothetical protein
VIAARARYSRPELSEFASDTVQITVSISDLLLLLRDSRKSSGELQEKFLNLPLPLAKLVAVVMMLALSALKSFGDLVNTQQELFAFAGEGLTLRDDARPRLLE